MGGGEAAKGGAGLAASVLVERTARDKVFRWEGAGFLGTGLFGACFLGADFFGAGFLGAGLFGAGFFGAGFLAFVLLEGCSLCAVSVGSYVSEKVQGTSVRQSPGHGSGCGRHAK